MSPQGMENELEMRLAESVGRVIVTSVDGSLSGCCREPIVCAGRAAARSSRPAFATAAHGRRDGGGPGGRGRLLGAQLISPVAPDSRSRTKSGGGVAVRDGDLVASSATDRTDVRFSDGTLVRWTLARAVASSAWTETAPRSPFTKESCTPMYGIERTPPGCSRLDPSRSRCTAPRFPSPGTPPARASICKWTAASSRSPVPSPAEKWCFKPGRSCP